MESDRAVPLSLVAQEEHMTDFIQRYYDCFNRRDLAAYERLFTPDCLIECPGVQLRGIEGARMFDQVWLGAMPDAQIINLRKATAPNVVMCENEIKGTHTGPLVLPDGTLPPSGRVFHRPYMAAFELSGERIKRQTLHFDRATVMMDLAPADATAKNLEIAKGIYDAFNRHDMGYILDALADDVTWAVESCAHEVPQYGLIVGKQNVPKFFAAFGATADFHTFGASDFVASGDHVFNTLSYELTVKATGKRVKNTGCAQHC